MLAFAAFFTISSGLVLRYLTVDLHVSSTPNSAALEPEKETTKFGSKLEVVKETDAVRKVDVKLVKYALDIFRPSYLGMGRSRRLNILKGISTTFEAGKLNGTAFPLRTLFQYS